MQPSASLNDDLRARLVQFLLMKCDPPRDAHRNAGENRAPESSASEGSEGRQVRVMTVDVMELLNACWELADGLLHNNTMATMKMLAAEVSNLFAAEKDAALVSSLIGQRRAATPEVALRFAHVPPLAAATPEPIGGSLLDREGKLATFTGTIVRLSARKVVPAVSTYSCGRCGQSSDIVSNPWHRGDTSKQRCTQKSCKGEVLQCVKQEWMDYAECRLQQRIEASGKLPRSVLVALEDELTTRCCVGQLVEVVGVVGKRWRSAYQGATPAIELVVWASNITPLEAVTTSTAEPMFNSADAKRLNPDQLLERFGGSRERLRVALLQSTCPQLAGVFAPKLGLLLAQLGGAAAVGNERQSHHLRQSIHMLLCGDPSTGKSQLLRFAAAVAPRSTSTTGVTSTNAGLTVAASKEFGEWVLEPGALVLSDGGTCCIDELRTVSAADRTSLHEAMEQQTISVAKAGMVTRLRTQCSVVAACNPPMHRKNPYGNVNVEIGVGGPLLSRFDMIFLMWDDPGGATDELISLHILECTALPPQPPLSTCDVALFLSKTRAAFTPLKGGPLLDDAAADILGSYYEELRHRGPSPSLCDQVPVTVRLLEALIRMTQAHAKLMQKPTCTSDDAAMAVLLMERSAHALKFQLPLSKQALQHVASDSSDTFPGLSEPQIFSSSKWLDDVFLSDTAEGIALQREVLCCISNRFASGATSQHDDEASDADNLLQSQICSKAAWPRKRSRSTSGSSSSQLLCDASDASSPLKSVACYAHSAFEGSPSPSPQSLLTSQKIVPLCGVATSVTISPHAQRSSAEDTDVLELADDGAPPCTSVSQRVVGGSSDVAPPQPLTKRSVDDILGALRFSGFGPVRR